MTNSLFVLRLTLATSNAAEMQNNTHLSVFHVVLRSGTSEDVSVDSNAVLAQENISLMFKKPYLFIVTSGKSAPSSQQSTSAGPQGRSCQQRQLEL